MTKNFGQRVHALIQADDSPGFRKFVAMLPESYWDKYDMNSVRLGWEAHKALYGGEEDAAAEFDVYRCNTDDSALYSFGKQGERNMIVLCLNPRTKDQYETDTTLLKIRKVASLNGYDGFLMAFLYPLRSNAHYELPSDEDPELLAQNIQAITDLVQDGNTAFWCAWGKNIDARSYFMEALSRIRNATAGTEWLHFGSLTQKGHPRHPSGLRYHWNFTAFDMDHYLARQGV